MAPKPSPANALYDAMVASTAAKTLDGSHSAETSKSRAKVFFQDNLLRLKVVKRSDDLLPLCQVLMNKQLLRVVKDGERVGYMCRGREEADKLLTLPPDDLMLYTHIEGAGTGGIWSKALKQRTKISQQACTKSLKSLVTKQLCRVEKNAKFPTKKWYILFGLELSAEARGGGWFTDGELDINAISELGNLVVDFVEKNSWQWMRAVRVKTERRDRRSAYTRSPSFAPEPAAVVNGDNRRKRPAVEDIECAVPKKAKTQHYREAANHEAGAFQLPYPAGYRAYPTVDVIHDFVSNSGILIVEDQPMPTQSDIQSLLDLLVFDDRLETLRTRGLVGYRSRMRAREPADDTRFEDGYGADVVAAAPGEGEGNGVSQAPCGRCPVFHLCEPGGPVSAENCIYFEEWLGGAENQVFVTSSRFGVS
ncbi:34-kDa subunit of RNA polymerase III (C) [Elasticomyces elasticus]|nr:34-kDa subunit of RNA polymerase III (C) [Elasticomyces elasticus]